MSAFLRIPTPPTTIYLRSDGSELGLYIERFSSITHFLHHLPWFVLGGCVLLVLVCCFCSVCLHRSSERLILSVRSLAGVFGKADHPRSWKSGLSFEEWSNLRSRMNSLSGEAAKWASCLSQHVEAYPSLSGDDVFYRTEGAREALPYTEVVSSMHAQRYSSFPGLLTGAGLTLTFIAILLALNGVTYDPTNSMDPIRGIDVLINGLSGKFTSSIVALSLSIAFTLYEQRRMRLVRCAYSHLLQTIDGTLPKLSPNRILLDIHQSLIRSKPAPPR